MEKEEHRPSYILHLPLNKKPRNFLRGFFLFNKIYLISEEKRVLCILSYSLCYLLQRSCKRMIRP
jgi:hypothetical protein